MKILQKGIMKNGTKIQIENWNDNYKFMSFGSTLATYPISKKSCEGSFSPKENKEYRFSFTFENELECKNAFDSLLSDEKCLQDYKIFFDEQKYIDCI